MDSTAAPKGLTPAQRSLRARIAAYAQHAQGRTNTAPATAAAARRFYEGIPESLPAAERDRRAALARRAHMCALSLKASRARSRHNRKAAPAIVTPEAAQEARGDRHERPSAA